MQATSTEAVRHEVISVTAVSTPRVFIPEPNERYNLKAAHRYGTVTRLCGEGINPFVPTEAIAQLDAALRHNHFNPELDFICFTGHQITVAYLLAAALNRYREINILTFNANSGEYKERRVKLPASL